MPIVRRDYLILACLVSDRGLDKCPAEKKTASLSLSDRYNTATSCCFNSVAILYYLLFPLNSWVAPKTTRGFFFFSLRRSSQGQRFLLPCSLRVMKQNRCIERLSARRIGRNMKSLILKFKEMKSKLNFYFHSCNLKRYAAEFLHFSHALTDQFIAGGTHSSLLHTLVFPL